MKKTILFYGLALAASAVALQWLDCLYAVKLFATEIYIVLIEEMAQMIVNFANPLFRLPMTFLEIFPVGLLITLISAGILRNSNVMPAHA